MGPRPFSRGKRNRSILLSIWREASMGPRPFSRGKAGVREDLGEVRGASMGPRPFSRGKGYNLYRHRQEFPASMGPRPFSRGKKLRQCGRQALLRRFNGAATFQSRKGLILQSAPVVQLALQWGRDLSVAERNR